MISRKSTCSFVFYVTSNDVEKLHITNINESRTWVAIVVSTYP